MPKKIEISHRTIVFTVFFLIFIWFLFYIREILIQFFVALLLMAILTPLVERLAKLKIPRPVSILFAYIIFFSLITIAVAGIVPPLVEQTTYIVNEAPNYLNGLGLSSDFVERMIGELVTQLGRLPSQVARITVNVFSDIFSILTVLIFAFYLLLSRNKLDDHLEMYIGDKKKKDYARIIDALEKRLGGWARGQLSLVFIIGLTTYIGLRLLGIPYALSLSILAGVLEVIPYVGPIIAAIPAVIIGFGISPVMGLASAALYLLIQQLENYILVPKVMQRSAGVSPIVTLLALAIGFKVAGIIGVIMSVPVVITIQVLMQEYLKRK